MSDGYDVPKRLTGCRAPRRVEPALLDGQAGPAVVLSVSSPPLMRFPTCPQRRAGLAHALLLALLVVGCGESTAPGEKVGSITLGGVPDEPLLVGSSVQLMATLLSESGATMVQRVEWKSSDAAIAAVSGSGEVRGVGPGAVTITASSGGQSATADIHVSVGGVIGAAGGTIATPDGRVKLDVLPNSIPQPTTVILSIVTSAPLTNRVVPGTIYAVAPAQLALWPPATLTIGYDPARIPSGLAAESLQLYQLQGGAWMKVPGSSVDVVTRQVRGTISGAGTYAVVSTGVDRIVLTSGPVNGVMYEGQTAQFAAAALDAANDTLRGRTFAWSTSDQSRATVDAAGKVTARGIGNVTITATAEGKAAATSVLVLGRPTADWTGALPWVTYQGNARHTGFVPVTADPSVFRELWSATPFGATALNPVAAADGKVLVSTRTYFGSQRLTVLNAATGTALWSHDFGGIHGVHPPAYGNGAVFVTTSGHQDSYLWSFDAGTGAIRFRSAYGNQWSAYFAPVVLGTNVYMPGGYYGGVYSFSGSDGAQRWFTTTNQYDEWTPAVGEGRVYTYTGSYSPKVTALDAASGAQLFEIADPAFSWSGWSMNLAPVLGAADNLLATNGGRLISFDLAGQRIGWQQTGSFTGTVAVASGQLYVVNSGQVDVRRESDGSLVGPWVPPTGSVQGPVLVTNNIFFASTASATYAVDIASRRTIWTYPVGGHLAINEAGSLLIATGTGKVVAIGLK